MRTMFRQLVALTNRFLSWTVRSGHLSDAQSHVLRALKAGQTLKSHRYLDGRKVYQLHAFNGDVERDVSAQAVEQLKARGLIDSNMKFPAATYLLTEAGAMLVMPLDASPAAPIMTRMPHSSMRE